MNGTFYLKIPFKKKKKTESICGGRISLCGGLPQIGLCMGNAGSHTTYYTCAHVTSSNWDPQVYKHFFCGRCLLMYVSVYCQRAAVCPADPAAEPRIDWAAEEPHPQSLLQWKCRGALLRQRVGGASITPTSTISKHDTCTPWTWVQNRRETPPQKNISAVFESWAKCNVCHYGPVLLCEIYGMWELNSKAACCDPSLLSISQSDNTIASWLVGNKG